MHLFYTPDFELNEGEYYSLNKEESTHCIKVLRLKEKDIICLTNGLGRFVFAEISDANPKNCSFVVTVVKEDYGKRDFRIHIAVAPTKNMNRMEWFLEKAIEMGVDKISFFIGEHSERTIIKRERLEKIMVSALKQSLKAYMPELNENADFRELVNSNETKKFIAYCKPDGRTSIKESYNKGEDVLILIGPEGDFSEKEVELALNNGFQAITLGESRLRTETAALFALQSIHFVNM
ncbi:MAG: 16S rRNA (uracil(1498)-N(3))-methyltransferase [Bacteroidales bacterium]|nr:16S rRNA (uracil(1498)-N(3))-methyltransferase [Bacteroidales bacterium]